MTNDSSLSVLPTGAIAPDVETFCFARAMMAPPIVCAQWAKPVATEPDGIAHAVEPTARVRDALHWIFSREHDQIWFHNGPYDISCALAWYPDVGPAIWQAFDEGRILDTMYLQRMGQILQGQMGPLALDLVTQMYGIPPPSKDTQGTHPDYPGKVFDVRRSFGLWYNAPEIPEPWHSYADYDGVATLRLAARQCARYCQAAPGKHSAIRLEDLAFVTRTYFGLNLSRIYGMRVDPRNVSTLANAANSAMNRLREAAVINRFLKPEPASREAIASGDVADKGFCKTQYEHPPRPGRPQKEQEAYRRRQERHKDCPGCAVQALATGPDGLVEPSWKLDTRSLERVVTLAYDGRPPLTEPQKGEDGRKTGGGRVSRSRDTLQDSGHEELMSWSEFNEWGALKNKDLKIFQNSPVHTNFSVTNNLRPASSAPNILNFRRKGFLVAVCPNPACGFEMSVDTSTYNKGDVLMCPACEGEECL